MKKVTQTCKRIAVVAAVSLAMLSASFHSSSALTEEVDISTENSTDDLAAPEPAVSSGTEVLTPSDDASSDTGSSGDTIVTPEPADNSGEDLSDNTDTDSSEGSISDPDTTDPDTSNDGISDTDTSNDSAEDVTPSDGDVTDTDPADDDPSNTETPDDSNSDADASNDASTDTTSSDSSSGPLAQPDNSSSSDSTVSVNPNSYTYDESPDAVYVQPSYNPSELFLNQEDKIKYNAALPIDNIPSFITQEMIIGALKCQDETGYPASVTIAQIIQESGFGKYGPGGEQHQGLSYLAFQYCNLFGIKGVGTAGTVDMRTGEQAASGEYYTITAGFRVYNTYTECIEDRTRILKEVYSDLTANVTDANTFAVKIGSRWATSLQYAQHLISQMEQYDLYRLDRMTLQEFGDMIGRFADPCPGSYITSSFGYRTFDNKFHKGIDLGTNGAVIPTYAAEAGTVITVGWNESAGNWIIIDHGNGLVTKYMHHSKMFVTEGQHVEKGQQIGLTGTTGNSTGIHLHFQVEENGVAVDPTPYLSPVSSDDSDDVEDDNLLIEFPDSPRMYL